jgi:hypothetical protein
LFEHAKIGAVLGDELSMARIVRSFMNLNYHRFEDQSRFVSNFRLSVQQKLSDEYRDYFSFIRGREHILGPLLIVNHLVREGMLPSYTPITLETFIDLVGPVCKPNESFADFAI